MRPQEYGAAAILVALVLAAWWFETSKEKAREEARNAPQVQTVKK
jgi:hypothetical protein